MPLIFKKIFMQVYGNNGLSNSRMLFIPSLDNSNAGGTGGQGNQGYQGFQGVQGINGTIGTNGSQGNQGCQGYQGYQGIGTNGSQGNQGYQGSVGIGTPGGSSGQLQYNSSGTFAGIANCTADPTGYMFPEAPSWVLGAGSNVVLGSDLSAWQIIPRNSSLAKVWMAAKTPPVGASIIIDIRYSTNGTTWTSLWATHNGTSGQADWRPTLASATYTSSVSSFDTTVLAEGSLLAIDVKQIGTSTPGGDVSVTLLTMARNQ